MRFTPLKGRSGVRRRAGVPGYEPCDAGTYRAASVALFLRSGAGVLEFPYYGRLRFAAVGGDVDCALIQTLQCVSTSIAAVVRYDAVGLPLLPWLPLKPVGL